MYIFTEDKYIEFYFSLDDWSYNKWLFNPPNHAAEFSQLFSISISQLLFQRGEVAGRFNLCFTSRRPGFKLRHFKTIEFLIKIIDRILNYRKNFRYKNLSNFILIATSTPENCFYIQPPTHQPWIILCLPQKLLWWYLIH